MEGERTRNGNTEGKQCCGSGMFIPDLGFFPDLGSRIPDLGSRIPDPKKHGEVKIFFYFICFLTFL
jgi:hypothetical protein